MPPPPPPQKKKKKKKKKNIPRLWLVTWLVTGCLFDFISLVILFS